MMMNVIDETEARFRKSLPLFKMYWKVESATRDTK